MTEHAGRVLDWGPYFDDRSLNFRIGAVAGTALPTSGRIWSPGPTLDQGREGACVGFGMAGEAAASPKPVKGINNDYALAWYHRAQDLDEWAGRNYEGTSVLAGCLVGRERGLWTGFRWAKSAEELAAGVVDWRGGPAVIGVTWHADSYDTDALGVLTSSGPVVGGHCILVLGYVPDRPSQYMRSKLSALRLLEGWRSINGPAFVIHNSWGEEFGKGGRALVPLEDMRQWVAERGEFAFPEGRRLPKAA